MNADSGHPLATLRVDGGLSNSDLCMQLQSNILGLEVARPQMRESTALGAATAAGVHLGIGIWKGGFKAFAERARESKEVLQIFTPKINDEGNDLTQLVTMSFYYYHVTEEWKGAGKANTKWERGSGTWGYHIEDARWWRWLLFKYLTLLFITVSFSSFYLLFLCTHNLEREKEYALWQKAIDTTIGVKSKTTGKREP